MFKYFFVEYRNAEDNTVEHNAVVRDFEEFCSYAQGRIAVIMGPATQEDYVQFKESEHEACS